MRKLSIRPEAEAEIVEAHDWYKLQAEGLSSEFLRAVDACLNSIERQPFAYPVVHKQVRRALLRKFPYSIFFLYEQVDEENESIIVFACFHAFMRDVTQSNGKSAQDELTSRPTRRCTRPPRAPCNQCLVSCIKIWS